MQPTYFEKYYHRLLLLIWLGFSVLLTLANFDNITTWQMSGPDDQMRLVQVRDWLAGQSWWDKTQYRMSGPEGFSMHWSRLVDIPLAGTIIVLKPILGQALAEQVAIVVVPLLTLGATIFLVAAITRRLFNMQTALLAALFLFAVPVVIYQLSPMRIDHHGWQLVMFLLSFLALIERERAIWAASLIGLACALWIEISVEGLPFAVIFVGLLAVRWVLPVFYGGTDASRHQFPVAISVLALVSTMIYFMSEGLPMGPNHCDALAPVHFFAFLTVAAIINLALFGSKITGTPISLVHKLIILAVAGALGITVVLWLAPACTKSPFESLDPLIKNYWYNHNAEGLPIWQIETARAVQLISSIMAGLVALIFLFANGTATNRMENVTIAILFVSVTLVGLTVSRTLIYPSVMAGILIAPIALDWFSRSNKQDNVFSRMSLRLLATGLLCPALVGLYIFAGAVSFSAGAASEAGGSTAENEEKEDCQSVAAVESLRRLPKSRIMADLHISPAILQHTPHHLAGAGYHRNQSAIKDIITAFTGSAASARRIYVEQDIDYLVGCSNSVELIYYSSMAPNGLWAQLQQGHKYDWLEPQPMIGPFHVWRVRKRGQ